MSRKRELLDDEKFLQLLFAEDSQSAVDKQLDNSPAEIAALEAKMRAIGLPEWWIEGRRGPMDVEPQTGVQVRTDASTVRKARQLPRSSVSARFREFIRPILDSVQASHNVPDAVALAFDPKLIDTARTRQGRVEFFDWDGMILARFESVSEPTALGMPNAEYAVERPETDEVAKRGYFVVKQFNRELALLFVDLSKRNAKRIQIKHK